MIVRIVFIVSLFLPFPVVAWDDDTVLAFIARHNPILLAQKNVTQAFAKPDALTWALQNTALAGRVGVGGTEFRDDPYTVFGGLQIQIPLSSVKEEREAALKQVAEAKAFDDLLTRVVADIVQLRQLEADLEASAVKRTFLKEKAAWVKDRIDQGYASDMDELWQIGSKVNAEDALVAKDTLLIKTQRYKIARYAGPAWRTLLAYLQGEIDTLEGVDG